jgi:phosphomannomutase
VAFVDDEGAFVPPEVVAGLLHSALSRRGSPLVASVDASMRLERSFDVARCRVGARFVVACMKRCGGDVGFECSGHYYLRRFGPDSDGLLTACQVLSILHGRKTRLSKVRHLFGPIHRKQRSLAFKDGAEAHRAFLDLRKAAGDLAAEGIDGFHLNLGIGSCLVRLSNTQPLVRITSECRDGRESSRLESKLAGLLSKLREVPEPRSRPRGTHPSD